MSDGKQMHSRNIKTIKLKIPSHLKGTKRSALIFCKITIAFEANIIFFCIHHKIKIHIRLKPELSTFNNKSYTYMYVKLYPGGSVIMLTHIIVI